MILLHFSVMCQGQNQAEFSAFGAAVTPENAVTVEKFLAEIDENTTSPVKLSGTIDEVCQMKGCWMTLRNASGTTLRVTFKDYGFFVPVDASGKEVIVEGMATLRQLDPETARHYADDAGKPTGEDLPASALQEVSVVATGVRIKD